MKFEKVVTENLDEIDFSLPDDHPATTRLLNHKGVKEPQFFVGCAISDASGRRDCVHMDYVPARLLFALSGMAFTLPKDGYLVEGAPIC